MKGEAILARWNGITLTTERVLQRSRSAARTLVLAKVDRASLTRAHRPWLLVLSGLSVLSTVLLMAADERVAPFGPASAALIGLVGYFVTRRVELRVGAGQGEIRAKVRGGAARMPEARAFLEAVHRALRHCASPQGS